MSDELNVDVGIPVYFFLEWKDHQHLIDKLFDLFYASLAPCPHLRADIIKNGRARLFNAFREAQVEIRKIDENCSRRSFAFDTLCQMAEDPIKRAQVSNDLEW